jgi:uncharacterized membrane protein
MSTTTEQTVTDEESHREPASTESGTGLDEDLAATLTYVLGWVTGIVMYVVEPERERVRFHAVQSIAVFGGLTVLSALVSVAQIILSGIASSGGTVASLFGGILSLVVGLLGFVVWLGGLAVWLYLLVRTYQGEDPRMPVAAGIADDHA